MKVHPWAAATAAFAAGTLAAVGIAQATSAPTKIPDSSTGVITACFMKKTGAVRFINAQAGKTCKYGEKKVTFNNKGPQGTTGVTGATGATGPSNTFVKAVTTTVAFDSAVPLLGAPPKNRLVTLNLPAGSYDLQAATSVYRTDASTTEIACEIKATAGTLTAATVKAGVNQQQYAVPLSISGTLSTTTDSTVYLRCDPYGPAIIDFGEADGATLRAMLVGQVTVQ
jgi:hypothetical protein